jgi:hypothetical protein
VELLADLFCGHVLQLVFYYEVLYNVWNISCPFCSCHFVSLSIFDVLNFVVVVKIK